MAEKKEKQYVSDNAHLMAEWDWEKNAVLNVNPESVPLGSHKKVWWKCAKDHEWQTTIKDRSRGYGCPYCSGRYAVRGENDLQTVNPTLAAEWNFERNNGLTPAEVLPNSNKKVWWKCKKGHEWQATINNRNRGKGCPYCSGKYIIKGENDLQTVNPTLAAEWNYEKNNGLTPSDILSNSNKSVWWICVNGHEWKTQVNNRSRGNGCPYCSGRNAVRGESDLWTLNPTLAAEWNYEKNNGLTPKDVKSYSSKKVWWKCQKGHEWTATIGSRNSGIGCPICSSERNTSFSEYILLYYLKKYGLDVMHSYREYGYELDIYIPSLKTAIEYDGYYWHAKKAQKDLEKNLRCEKDGIKLYRIREGLPQLNSSSIDYVIQKNLGDLAKTINALLTEIIGFDVDVDLDRDTIAIGNLREYIEKECSILFSNPDIAKEWNYERNGNLKPENFIASSKHKVWWKCSKGHEWLATIGSRNEGNGCPYCAGRKVLAGYNDLQTKMPGLAAQWHPVLNGELTPADVTISARKYVWWKCTKGHEWQAWVYNRSKGIGCPYCAGRYAVKGENDLQTINPGLADEWNYDKNIGLTPADVMPNSGKKVWWKCSEGHEWQAAIYSRNNGNGCPQCAREKRKKK